MSILHSLDKLLQEVGEMPISVLELNGGSRAEQLCLPVPMNCVSAILEASFIPDHPREANAVETEERARLVNIAVFALIVAGGKAK